MYQIPRLLKYPKLFHAFSTKTDGNMANSILGKIVNFENVLDNRKRFFKKIGVDINKCVCMWVTHGDEIIEVPTKSIGVSMKDYKEAIKVDGLMTNESGIYLFLLIADCLPIIIYDRKKNVVALIHAGWKGVGLEIAGKALGLINKKYTSEAKDIIVGIGPCVHKDSFIKKNPSQLNSQRWRPFLKNLGYGRYSVDLIGYTKQQLISAGILESNIIVSKIDTVKNKRFFSHVREKDIPLDKQGRFACVVGLIE